MNRLLPSKVDTHTLAVCNVSGIAVAMDIPTIGVCLDYYNPIAHKGNCFDLAQLPADKLMAFDSVILAGILLSVMHHNNLLVKDSNSAALRNVLIQSIPKETIICLSSFYATLPKDRLDELPSIRIAPVDTNERRPSTTKDVLMQHAKDIRNILNPPQVDEVSRAVDEEVQLIQDNKKSMLKVNIAAFAKAQKALFKEANQSTSGSSKAKEAKATIINNAISDDEF